MFFHETGEGLAGKLGVLIGIEDIRSVFPQRFFQRQDAETNIQVIGEPPGEHITDVPIDDGYGG